MLTLNSGVVKLKKNIPSNNKIEKKAKFILLKNADENLKIAIKAITTNIWLNKQNAQSWLPKIL